MFKQGKVKEIKKKWAGLSEVIVDLEGNEVPAINYDLMIGELEIGDSVILNTTALELKLGTGGSHFVLWNLKRQQYIPPPQGHIMKLRYTPLQLACLAVEEQGSPHHHLLKENTSIAGMPVVVGELHSQLPAVCATIKEVSPKCRICYIMTDGGALPIAFSRLVAELKEKGLVESTITVGNAFGGDLEAINIFSGLVAAQTVSQADIAVVMMGPGIAGSDTILGFSGIEQGTIINAVNALGGTAIAIPRLSFQDKRPRHYGVSHHTLTILSLVALSAAIVPIPIMDDSKMRLVEKQFRRFNIYSKHQVEIVNEEVTLKALKSRKIEVSTMGRIVDEEPEFFRAAGAAGIVAVRLLGDKLIG